MRVARFSLLLVLLVMAACSPAPESPTPTPSPTLVPSSTPRPAVTENDYSGIPTGATDVGFPTLGESDAPVTLRMFGSYDSDATRRAHEEVFAPLLPRVRTGEVLVVYVPLSGTGTTANGAEAARAALCAGEQNVFWSYHSQLFARLATEGSDAFTGNALLDTADAVGLGREDYLACMESDRPDAVLSAATAAAADEPNYSGTPTLLANGNYMLNDYIAINRVVDQMLSRVDADGGVVGEATPIPTAENFELPPVAFQNVGTPIDIALPEGWEIVLNDSMIVQDIDAIRTIPFVLYKGPVQSGTGSIALLWGFPSLLAGNPFSAEAGATPVPNLLTDGLRLLRLAVVEPGCNIGTAEEQTYTVGAGISGAGTRWSAVDCPELPDTRGWFVGTQQNNLNYLFYVYLDPIDPAGETPEEQVSKAQLQAVLDSVTFRTIDEIRAESEATPDSE